MCATNELLAARVQASISPDIDVIVLRGRLSGTLPIAEMLVGANVVLSTSDLMGDLAAAVASGRDVVATGRLSRYLSERFPARLRALVVDIDPGALEMRVVRRGRPRHGETSTGRQASEAR